MPQTTLRARSETASPDSPPPHQEPSTRITSTQVAGYLTSPGECQVLILLAGGQGAGFWLGEPGAARFRVGRRPCASEALSVGALSDFIFREENHDQQKGVKPPVTRQIPIETVGAGVAEPSDPFADVLVFLIRGDFF